MRSEGDGDKRHIPFIQKIPFYLAVGQGRIMHCAEKGEICEKMGGINEKIH